MEINRASPFLNVLPTPEGLQMEHKEKPSLGIQTPEFTFHSGSSRTFFVVPCQYYMFFPLSCLLFSFILVDVDFFQCFIFSHSCTHHWFHFALGIVSGGKKKHKFK